MAANTRNRWLDVPLSILLGMSSCALLGYLMGLRILVWNPDLSGNFRNVIFLSLSMIYLYSIVGALLGLVLWFVVRLWGRIALRIPSGRTFVGPWLTFYWIGATLIFAYLALTRQHIRSNNFDNFGLVAYYVSFIFFSFWLRRSLRARGDGIPKRYFLFTLPKFFILCAVYLIVTLAAALIAIPRHTTGVGLGDKAEIEAALKSPNDSTRVAVIGWDGAEWSVINKLFEQGRLPNLKHLVDNGVAAPYRSLDVVKSPLIWTSMATGKTPEKHGIQDFGSFQFAGMPNNFLKYPDGLGLYRLITLFQRSADLPITSTARRCEAIWSILSEARRSVGVVGWWATWPAEKVNGFIVSDRFTYTLFNPRASVRSLTEGQTYPPGMLQEIKDYCRLPESITEAELNRFMPHQGKFAASRSWGRDETVDWNPMYQFRLAFTSAESFEHAGMHLYQEHHPDLYAIYFEGTDMVSHFFWQYYEPEKFDSVAPADIDRFGQVIPQFYCYLDEILGQYLQTLTPGTDVILVSDHGFEADTHPNYPFRTGNHKLHGVFVACGPHFQKGVKLDSANVLDLTPTLLYLYGLPVGRDMDGKILTGAIDSSFQAVHPPAYIKSYETGRHSGTIVRSGADSQIKDQIRALGYTQ
jgi:predicted AlkP superfamily phosphohydrolase/phosphomutase